MKVYLPSTDRTVHVKFHHERHEDTIEEKNGYRFAKEDTYTECILSLPMGGSDLQLVGRAYLNPVDQFCGETGRRKSLDRVLMLARDFKDITSKEEREIWVGYFSR
jgi:hypothetical protein